MFINNVIYVFSFIIGTLLGSFCTLAVYRIPLGQDITHKRSYCPNCKHRLEMLDLIPILSYLFLKGKCKYCGQKVRIRYLLLEVLFGLTYMLFIISLHLDVTYLSIDNLIYILFATLFLVSLFLIAGIDKEKKEINKPVLIFGIISSICYIVYLYIIQANVYRYAIYLILLITIISIEYIKEKEGSKNFYILELITLMLYILSFTSEISLLFTILLTIVIIIIKVCFSKDKKQTIFDLKIGYYICISNIVCLIIQNYLLNWDVIAWLIK